MNRIALISDLHIKQNGLAYDVDTHSNFLALLEELKGWDLDHIICAGDLSAREPDYKDCLLVKQELEALEIPFSVITGNHDKSEDVAKAFGYELEEDEVYYTKKIGENDYIFLDTKQGSVSENQCLWLTVQLQGLDSPRIVMHYPPFESGIPFMDANHRFKSSARLLEILTSSEQNLNIFCGHCHAERYLQFKNLNIHITPSCLVQIDERSVDFKEYHRYIGFRIIEEEKSVMRTYVKYLFE